MPRFSEASEAALASCDERIQRVLRAAIQYVDFAVTEGHRSHERQEELYARGLSKARAGQSKHNMLPSRAVDVAPYPIDWKDRERFTYLGGLIRGLGLAMGVDLRWGGDWDRDGDTADNRFDDLPHFELHDPHYDLTHG